MVQGLVEVRFLPKDTVVMIREGSTILAAGEAAGVDILTGCENGMCGTDPVRILSGAEGLDAPEEHELGTLERMGAAPDLRLSCSAVLRSGVVEVELIEF